MVKLSTFVLLLVFLWSCEPRSTNKRFELISSENSGIHFNNQVVEKDSFNILHNEYMYNGAGVGIGDLDNDGFQDIVLCGNTVSSKVYLNNGDWTFEDATTSLLNMDSTRWMSGVNVIDINGDGWKDIYFSITQGTSGAERKNQLWINQGNNDGRLTFKEEANNWGIADGSHSTHSAFFDADIDGDLDLYVMNNIINRQTPTVYRPKIADGSAKNSDNFYINNGDQTFTMQNEEANILVEGFGLGIAISDFNKDHYPDIYVSNDYVSNDLLYINQRDGSFSNEIENLLSCQSRFSMGNDVVDLNNDAYPEILTLDMLPKYRPRYQQTISGENYNVYLNDSRFDYERQYSRNMLHTHNGLIGDEMTRFSEVANLANISATEWSWSVLGADYNNDGSKDLIITNGFPKDVTDKDFAIYKAATYGYLTGDDLMLKAIPEVKVQNFAFEQKSNKLGFTDVTTEWGMDIPSFSNGAAYVDLDNDGDLDYICSNINDPVFLFKNMTIEREAESTNYLKINLEGKAPNTMAIGTKVHLYTSSGQQYYEHFLTRGYLSSVEPVVHFGLGAETEIDSLVVIWPGGKTVSKLYSIKSNQTLELNEDSSDPIKSSFTTVEDLYFDKVEMYQTYTHKQLDFIDFFQPQRSIQHKFSHIGPVISIADIDGDGTEELLAGANNNQGFEVYSILENALIKKEEWYLDIPDRHITGGIAVLDAENDGDKDLIITGGGYEYDEISSYNHYLFRQTGKSQFTRETLPIPPFVSSIIEYEDFDQDNDMDVFIGRRVDRLKFPQAGPSFVLINNNGKFTEEGIIPLPCGMVTDAIWSDLNGDGWSDLVVVSEWGEPIAYYNQEGSLSNEASSLQNNLKGVWTSIQSDDIDGDGDMDLVLGNLGTNASYKVNAETPMRLYALDIDNNGVIDPIYTTYWQDENGKQKEYPIHFWDELTSQSPYFRNRFESYAEYGSTTFESIIKGSEIPDPLEITTLESGILWNENNSWEWQAFENTVQRAPIREILVNDFDQDGSNDMLLLGNDYSYNTYIGEFDANRGLLLKGNGQKGFTIIPQSKSGLNIYGQVEHASIIDLQGISYLIIGINRDDLEMYRINKTVL